MYLKYILILLKFVVTILFTILICHHSLHRRSGLETRLYNHVRVNCSTSRHKTTAVGGGGDQNPGGRWRWRDEGGLDGGDVL